MTSVNDEMLGRRQSEHELTVSTVLHIQSRASWLSFRDILYPHSFEHAIEERTPEHHVFPRRKSWPYHVTMELGVWSFDDV